MIISIPGRTKGNIVGRGKPEKECTSVKYSTRTQHKMSHEENPKKYHKDFGLSSTPLVLISVTKWVLKEMTVCELKSRSKYLSVYLNGS